MSAEQALGATPEEGGVRFAVWSSAATALFVSVFDGEEEVGRVELAREGDVFSGLVEGLAPGALYGLRAEGTYDPSLGFWFDPDKLLMDPYAVEIDRPYVYDARLAAPRGQGGDTAPLMPKAIVRKLPEPVAPRPPLWRPGGLVYELQVRSFSMRHPDVPPQQRGTLAALAHPAVIEHLTGLGVTAVELMPLAAWIDERHLPPLGLRNGWGYNPVSFMALDPRLTPGGLADLRGAVEALHGAGIGVILDMVFNHTGESDAQGPTLSLRGLDNRAYYRHAPGEPGRLVNDTGTGSTLACDHPAASRLVLDTLRHFVRHAGVDGFRFDLATVLGRTRDGFDPDAPLLAAIAGDPALADRLLVAEPWDIGAGGYQLGRFPGRFLEWNDRFRDDVRRFWRGDAGTLGSLATRLSGSSDLFAGAATRTVNFGAAHDGMTLADLTAYGHKHNDANGEQNRDGHGDDFSWNGGTEGETADLAILARRARDRRALLATLFSSRGAVLLTAGDEFGRSQRGNNNAYAQDNELTWLDWQGRDRGLEAFVAGLSRLRRQAGLCDATRFLTGEPGPGGVPDVEWLRPDGGAFAVADWEAPGACCLAMVLAVEGGRLAVLVNGSDEPVAFALPGGTWQAAGEGVNDRGAGAFEVGARSVGFAAQGKWTAG